MSKSEQGNEWGERVNERKRRQRKEREERRKEKAEVQITYKKRSHLMSSWVSWISTIMPHVVCTHNGCWRPFVCLSYQVDLLSMEQPLCAFALLLSPLNPQIPTVRFMRLFMQIALSFVVAFLLFSTKLHILVNSLSRLARSPDCRDPIAMITTFITSPFIASTSSTSIGLRATD